MQASAAPRVAPAAAGIRRSDVQPVRVCVAVLSAPLTPLRRPLLLFLWANRQAPVGDVAVKKPDQEWRAALSPEAYSVLIGRGTERAFTSPLEREKRKGTFCCAGCGAALFASADKFNSGTGWPSFTQGISQEAVKLTLQPVYCLGDLAAREVRCARCGGHQGHVFTQPSTATGKRYCINGVALAFKADDAEGPAVDA